MRILLIAPDSPDINSVPEIRSISSKHHATVLNGSVSAATIDQFARLGFKAFHFAGHSTPDFVQLSQGERLEADDLVRFAHMAKVELLFFNSCEAGKLAAYAVAHGVSYAIAATIKLDDRAAWTVPSAFYEALANGAWRDILGAWLRADSGNGEYSLAIAPAVHMDCAEQVDELRMKMTDTVILQPRTVLLVVMLSLFSLFVVALLMIAMSGRGFS